MTTKIAVTNEEFMQLRRTMPYTHERIIVGSNSIFDSEAQIKYINIKKAKSWPNLLGKPELMTPSEAARTEFRRQYPHYKRPFFKTKDMVMAENCPPPMLWTGEQYIGTGYHIDLVSAYAQILRACAWDDCYPNGLGDALCKPVVEKLWHWKAARNSIAGLSISKGMTMMTYGKRIEVSTISDMYSPALWVNLQAYMHSIAVQAVRAGAIYVNTDGYIIPDRFDCKATKFIEWLETELSLDVRYDKGYINIKGWSCYKSPLNSGTVSYNSPIKPPPPRVIDTIGGYAKAMLKSGELFRDLEAFRQRRKHTCGRKDVSPSGTVFYLDNNYDKELKWL